MSKKRLSTAMKRLVAFAAAIGLSTLSPSAAFAISPNDYAVHSCWPNKWYPAFADYWECFEFHKAQLCASLPPNDPYLEQCG